jgi:hypothetical protein
MTWEIWWDVWNRQLWLLEGAFRALIYSGNADHSFQLAAGVMAVNVYSPTLALCWYHTVAATRLHTVLRHDTINTASLDQGISHVSDRTSFFTACIIHTTP